MKELKAEPLERLSGSIEKIVFHSQDTGFCVLRIKVRGQQELVTITGNAASVSPGEYVDCQGHFINDHQYGLQFKATGLSIVQPGTAEGIEKYLGSGMIKGIGPHFAKKLVKAFAEDVFNVIEQNPEKLLSLPGIGQVRMQQVVAGWAEQKIIREIMIFLQSYGLGTARAVRIYKTYGNESIAKVSENPYRLALDIYGIGFKTADAIANKLGIEADAPMRMQAGVRHALQELASQGHCACEYSQLIKAASKLLAIKEELIGSAIEHELAAGNLIAENFDDQKLIYLKLLQQAEQGVSDNLRRLQNVISLWSNINVDKELAVLADNNEIILSPSQQDALKLALSHKVLVITGGPGVGKTTLVKSILQIICARDASVLLCAPTGRAAKKLSESTQLEAKTIHRLLEFDPKFGGFKRRQDNPLTADVVVVDEASMIDIVLMNQLLQAIPDKASLILIGDVDQLPSVGSGSVLGDIIKSEAIATVRLTEIFRQAAASKIVVNAHRVNQGQMPEWQESTSESTNELSDFYFINAETPELILDKLLTVVCDRIPKRFGLHPVNDIQVLAPMNRGGIGARVLNIELQKRLNQSEGEAKVTKFGSTFAAGDKVIQLVNNYNKEVFNGDIGTIGSIDIEEGIINIDFDGRSVIYEINELDEIALAYAISIHKSQGSEYKAVVIPLSTAHYMMLQRNLLYTAITRGKQLVVIIGQSKALAMAVHNKRSTHRVTALQQRLRVLP